MSSDDQNSKLERKLQGRTLQVYLYLQKKRGPLGIREIQRDLGLSSPSVAEYQVTKLVEMGLASRDSYGRVFIIKEKVKIKALESYINFGRFTVPRLGFYACIFTMIAALYAIFSAGSMTIYGIAVPSAAAAIFWLEAWKMWKHTNIIIEKAPKAKENEKEVNQQFWISLMPGAAALAVFLAASFFLFYYVEPNSSIFLQKTLPPTAEQQSSQLTPTTSTYDQPMTADESVKMAEQKMALVSHDNNNNNNKNNSSGTSILLSFSPILMPVLLMAGTIVTSFLVYLMLRYRCDIEDSVLTSEQSWN